MNDLLTSGRAVWLSGALFAAVLLALEGGWVWGRRALASSGQGMAQGTAAIQTSVFALMGLLLAFSFGAAQSRLEARRAQIVQEINAVRTAYLRIATLNPADQPAQRALFRSYLDARLRVYDHLADLDGTRKALAEAAEIRDPLWEGAVAACHRATHASTCFLTVPAVTLMFDAATPRTVALDARTPAPVLLLLWILVPVSGLLGGFAMSVNPKRSHAHILLYSLIVAVTFYVILDLDNARFGLIRLTAESRMLRELRETMN